MLFWPVITLLGLGVVASLWPHRYSQKQQEEQMKKHGKAKEHYCYPVFAVLAFFPLAFLVINHLAVISLLASVIFWLVWAITLLVVVAFTREGGFWGALVALFAATAFVLLPISSTFPQSTTSDPAASAQQNVGGDEAKDRAKPGTGTAPETCKPAFKQDWQNNPDFRVIDGGLYEDVAHHKITPEQADKKQRQIAGTDVRALAGYAYAEDLRDNADYVDLLSPDKSCLSTQGVALYEKLLAKWDKGKVSIVQASASATNTGMENSRLVVNSKSGITGDKTALRRTYSDGSTKDTLARCGNPVFPGKPKHIPPGRTDQHPPKETPPPTSTTTPPATTPPPTSTTPPPTSTTTPPPTSTTTPPPTSTTTPPTTTPPPPTTTPPTTTPPEECKYLPPGNGLPPDSPECLKAKDGDDNHHDDGDNGKPPATTEGPVETTTPVETHPADPADTPGGEATHEPADGATQQPTTEPTQPPATGAPSEGTPGGTPSDPDGNNVAGMFAAPLVGLGALLRRKRLGA